MECVKYLNSFDEIVSLVSEVQFRRILRPGVMEHYRGQGRPEYKLLPNLARGADNAVDVSSKEDRLIQLFKNELIKNGMEQALRIDEHLGKKENLWNILIQMQHYSIPTRLLDWSLKWEVGLWFAVENSENDEVDGQFWIFTVPDEIHSTSTRDNYYNKDIDNLDKTYFINAPIYWSDELSGQVAEIKRQRQHGKFSISPFNSSFVPLEDQPEISPYLEKYCIPARLKGQLRLELTSKGFHEEWLYYREKNSPKLEELIGKILS